MNNMIFQQNKTKKGFTLLEMIVSIFIFAIIMTSVASIFARQIASYKQARTMEGDLENAQFALNYISKTLRTASILGHGTSTGNITDFVAEIQKGTYDDDDFSLIEVPDNLGLIVYDFSQEACVLFTFRPDNYKGKSASLWVETQPGIPIADIEQCLNTDNWHTNNPATGYKNQRLTTGTVGGSFHVASTRYHDEIGSRGTDTMGRATISMKVEPDEHVSVDHVEPVYIQSSVALRDYPSDLSF